MCRWFSGEIIVTKDRGLDSDAPHLVERHCRLTKKGKGGIVYWVAEPFYSQQE